MSDMSAMEDDDSARKPRAPLDRELTSAGQPTPVGDTGRGLSVGALIDGRYVILAPGIAGGMGVVYHVRDRELGDERAVKMIHPHLVRAAGAVERFRDEARHALRLLHPGIVRIFHFGDWGGEKYLVMEWVVGGNLRQLLQRRSRDGQRSMPIRTAIGLVDQVGEAVAYAHSQDVIHRDIKPENILLEGEQPKLVDFGISKLMTAGELSTTAARLGAAYYMAPEQLQGRDPDARADIYSLGVVLYELLCGAVPSGYFSFPHELDPSLPEAIDPLLKRCLANQPEQRYASVGEFLEGLGDIAASTHSSTGAARSGGDCAQRLLAVIEEIHKRGRGIIGPRWTLLARMQEIAARGDLEGMRTYYEACLRDSTGRRVGQRLLRAGCPNLETEHARFAEIYRECTKPEAGERQPQTQSERDEAKPASPPPSRRSARTPEVERELVVESMRVDGDEEDVTLSDGDARVRNTDASDEVSPTEGLLVAEGAFEPDAFIGPSGLPVPIEPEVSATPLALSLVVVLALSLIAVLARLLS